MVGVLFTAYHPDPNKPLKRTALFGCSTYTITCSEDQEFPKQFDPALFPLRQVTASPTALSNPGMTIDVKDLEVFTATDLCKIYDNESIESYAPVGYGKIVKDSSRGKMAAIFRLSYERGADNKDTYWSKVRTGKDKKELLIPISYLNYNRNYPTLDNTSLPPGTTISFNYGFEVTTGKNFACNIRIVTLLNSRNMHGSPACKLESKIVKQPNGHFVDIHVHEHELTIEDEQCKLLRSHVAIATEGAPWTVHVYFRKADANGSKEVSIMQLGRYLQQQYNSHWYEASLDQMVEAYVAIKKNSSLTNAFLSKNLAVTFIFSLTNQNYLQLATKQIHNSFNLHGQNGHTHLHKHTGVIVIFRPENHSASGSVSQVNHLDLLSKAACSALGKTYTHKPGYAIEYNHSGNKRGRTHAFLSLAVFSDSAKSLPLLEQLLEPDPSEAPTFTPPNTLIKVQYIPGTISAPHPVHKTINSDEFQKITEKYNYGTYEASKNFKYRTVIISAKPGNTKAVIAKLKSHPGVLVMPEDQLDSPGALLRSRVPFPKDAEEIVKSEEALFSHFLNQYTLRIIFDDRYGPECLPKLLKMQTSAAHSEDNPSLVVQNNSVWSEVTTNASNTILGRTPSFISTNDPHSIFLAGFRGITPSGWIEENILHPNLGGQVRIVDSKEETAQGGVFIQHLKPSRAGAIGPSGAETVLCLYTTNTTTLQSLKELSNHISSLSNSTIYPITDGLQYLTLRADALSVESEGLLDAAALAEFWNPPQDHPDQLPPAAAAYSHPSSVETAWVDSPISRNSRKQKAAPSKTPTPTPTKKNYTPVLASTISDDDEDELPVPAPSTSKRTPDQGDFNINNDKVITAYFKNNLKDSPISDSQREQLVKKVINIWSTVNPDYHKTKLGNNFTGNSRIGRLLVNAVKHDTSLLKGLHSSLDKHIANHDSNIKDLEVSISGMITTQQHQKETAAANKANKKAAAKTNPTTPVSAPTTTNTTTPTDKQNPKPKATAFQQYFSNYTPPSTTTTPSTSSPPTASNVDTSTASDSATGTASSSYTSTASDSASSSASSSSSASCVGSGSDIGNSSSNTNNPPNSMEVEGDDPEHQ